MSTVGEEQGAPDQSYEHGFQAPRRRQKALAIVTVVVFAAVGFLVFLMARGPDADVAAQRLVDAALTVLPEGDLSPLDLQAAAAEFQRALETSPGNAYVLEATASLQERVAGQVGADIERGALDRADVILVAASESWSGSEIFGDAGELRGALDNARLERQIHEEVSELIAAAQAVLAGGAADDATGGERVEDIGVALEQLRQALDLDPGNDSAHTLRDDVRLDLMAATRRELDAGNPDRAQELLDVAQNEWSGDDGIVALHDELGRLLDEITTAAELQRLNELGERRLAGDNLSTPSGDSAVDYFRQALALDPDNERAGAGLAQVADRYALLVRDAVERADAGQARRLLSRLSDVAPQHPEAGPLQTQVEAAAEAGRVQRAQPAGQDSALVAVTGEPSSSSTPPATSQGPVIADDEEGRLWSAVMNECDESQLRRYIDAYPAGRYIEEAWRRRSACLEAR